MVVASRRSRARRVFIRHDFGDEKERLVQPEAQGVCQSVYVLSIYLLTVRKTTATVRHIWHCSRTEGRKEGRSATLAPVVEWGLKLRYSLIDCAWLKAFGCGNIGDCDAWITLVVNSWMENDTT